MARVSQKQLLHNKGVSLISKGARVDLQTVVVNLRDKEGYTLHQISKIIEKAYSLTRTLYFDAKRTNSRSDI